MKEKKINNIIHFKKRVFERFAVQITNDDIRDITYQITSDKNKPIWINNNDGASFHLFTIQNIEMVIVFNWDEDSPITAYYTRWFIKDGGRYYPNFQPPKKKDVRNKDKSRTHVLKLGFKWENKCKRLEKYRNNGKSI